MKLRFSIFLGCLLLIQTTLNITVFSAATSAATSSDATASATDSSSSDPVTNTIFSTLNSNSWAIDRSFDLSDPTTFDNTWISLTMDGTELYNIFTLMSSLAQYVSSGANINDFTDKAKLNVADAAVMQTLKMAMGQVQAFAEKLGTSGSADAQSMNLSPSSLISYVYYIKAFFEFSLYMGMFNPKGVQTNYFGAAFYDATTYSQMLEGLVMIRAMYYSMRLRGVTIANDGSILNAMYYLTEFDRRGLLISSTADAIPYVGNSIDYIFTQFQGKSGGDITRPFVFVGQKANSANPIFINVDPNGVISGIAYQPLSKNDLKIPPAAFNYSKNGVFSVVMSMSNFSMYVRSLSSGKLVGKITNKSAYLTTSGTEALSRDVALGSLFGAASGAGFNGSTFSAIAGKDVLEYFGLSSFSINMITSLGKATLSDQIAAIKTSIINPAISGTLSLSKDQFIALGAQLKNVFFNASKNVADAAVIDSSIIDIMTMLIKLRRTFQTFLAADANAAGLFGPALATGEADTDVNHIVKLIVNDPARIYSAIRAARSVVLYSARINNLKTRFAAFASAAELPMLMSDLEDLTSVTPKLAGNTAGPDLTKLGNIVQAFDPDIVVIKAMMQEFVFKPAYTALQGADKTAYDARVQGILTNLRATITVEEYLQDLKNFEAARQSGFTPEERDIFLKKLDRILDFKATALNMTSLSADLSNLLNKVKYNQMKDSADLINQRLSQLGSVGSSSLFTAKVAELKAFAISPNNVNDFIDKIKELVAMKTEANKKDIEDLYYFLVGKDVQMNPAIFEQFDSNNKGYSKTITGLASQLQQTVPFSTRVASLRTFLQNNTQNTVSRLSDSEFNRSFVNPLLEKFEWMIFEKDNASQTDLQNLAQLLVYARENQFSGKLDKKVDSQNVPSMFKNKTVIEVLDLMTSQMQYYPGGKQPLVDKLNQLTNILVKISPEDLSNARSIVELEVPRLLMQKIDYVDAELVAFKKFLETLRWNNNIQEMRFSTTAPAPAQSDQPASVIVVSSFAPYLDKVLTYQEVFDLIKPYEAIDPLDPNQQKAFLSRTNKLIPLLAQASVDELQEALTFYNRAMYNYMRNYQTTLAPLVAKISDALNVKLASLADSEIPNYLDLKNQFEADLRSMTSQNYNLKVNSNDSKDRLNTLIDELKYLDQNKVYGLAADVQALLDLLSSKTFTAHEVMVYYGGNDLFKPIIASLSNPVPFLRQLQSFKSLVKKVLEGTSISALDYKVNLLQEKLVFLSKSAADLFNNKVNLDVDIFPIIDSLSAMSGTPTKLGILSQISSATNYFNSLDELKERLRTGYRNQQLFNLPFSAKLAQVDGMISNIKANDDAVAFVEYLQSLVNKKVEATAVDMEGFSKMVNRAIYQSNLIALYNDAKGISNTRDVLDGLTSQMATPVNNLDRLNWLMDMLSSSTLASHHPNLILQVLGDLIQRLNGDSSANTQLPPLVEACKRAMYGIMSGSADKMKSIINAISDYVGKIALTVTSPEIQSLQRNLDSLMSNAADVRAFVSALESVIKNRLDLKDDEVTQLNNIINILQSKRAFTAQKSYSYSGNISIEQMVKNLMDVLAKTPTYAERFDNLKTFYEKVISVGVTEADKQVFMDKLQKTVASRNDNLVQFEDDPKYDLVYALVLLLQEAAYDKITSRQQEILQIADDMARFRATVKSRLQPRFKTRYDMLKAKLNKLATPADAQSFLQDCKSLATDRVQGTKLLLLDISNWLKQPSVSGKDVIYKAVLNNEILAVAADLANLSSVSLQSRYSELQRMIQKNQVFTQELQAEFYEKLDWLITDFAVAASQPTNKPTAPTKDQLKEVLNYSLQNIFGPNDSYQKNSLGNDSSYLSTSKNYQVLVSNMISILDGISLTATAKSFADRINDLRTTFDAKPGGSFDNTFSLLNDTNVNLFVDTVNGLLADKVDAVKEDLEIMENIFNSPGFSTHPNLYRKFGNFDFAANFLNTLKSPILYTDRVKNIKTFAENFFFKSDVKPTAAQKRILLNKFIILVEERWKAKTETFDVKVLRDLIKAIMISQFNVNNSEDKAILDQMNPLLDELMTPAQTPKQNEVNYDFAVDIALVTKAFNSLTAETFDDFLKTITDVATRRVNAVYVQDSSMRHQAETLYDFLTSSKVMLHEVVYAEGNQQKVAQAAQALIQPVTFQDMYKNLYNFVLDNSTFSSSMKSLFLKKLDKIVRFKKLAAVESFPIQKMLDLMDFVSNNRVSFDQATKTFINNKKISITKTELDANNFDSLLSNLKNTYFAGLASSDPNLTLKVSAANTAANFISTLESIFSYKADSLPSGLNDLISIITNRAVTRHPDIMNSQELQDKLKDLTAKFKVPVTFAEYAANLVAMLKSSTTFTDSDAMRFKAKLKNLVDNRAEAYSSGYDMSQLGDWIDYALANQMKNDQQVQSLYKALLTQPISTSTQAYQSYMDKVLAKKAEFEQFGTNAAAKTKVLKWIKDLQALVDIRVDGMVYNINDQTEDDAALQELIKYLDNKVRYTIFVTQQDPENIINNYLIQLRTKPTYTDLVNNFKAFIDRVNLFTGNFRTDLENKLARLIDRRSEATEDQKSQLVRKIKVAQINKFQPAEEGNFLDDIVNQINSSPESITTTPVFDVSSIQARINALMNSDVSSINKNTPTNQIAFYLLDNGTIKQAIDALASNVAYKNDVSYKRLANQVKSFMDGMNLSLTGNNNFTPELRAKFGAYMGQLAPLLS